LTQLEDSEAIIRAYKKKKNELETLRESYYSIETKFFTVNQEHALLDEENSDLKSNLKKLERKLKESQLREAKYRHSSNVSQQLDLKNREVEVYQREV